MTVLPIRSYLSSEMDCAVLLYVWAGLLIFNFSPSESILIIIPEDVATGFAGIYGFSPRIVKVNDQRLGFGFRFGNHADLQVQYEFGPQIYTRPLEPINRLPSARIRSTTYRQRVVRRKPFIELLLRAGILRESSYDIDVQDEAFDEPR